VKTKTQKEVFQHSSINLPTYGAYILDQIKWSPNGDKAVIIPSSAIEPNDSRIMIYYSKNDSLYLYKNLERFDYTYRNDISWFNDDVFIYSQGGNALYSFDTSIKVSVHNTGYNNYSYSLKQNYPNPFNPTTIINYSVPKQSKVTIIVFDVLGREITKLIDEEKNIGNYEIQFDGSNLSSGIYFYQIRTAGFIQTKKMLLLK